MDEGRPVLKLCSDECQQLYEEQHGKQQQTEGTEEEKPLVLRTPLIPSAFVVECPCCEQTNEVLTWEVQASGAYAAADEPNDICTIMTCTACGSILEPVAVAVTPAEQPA